MANAPPTTNNTSSTTLARTSNDGIYSSLVLRGDISGLNEGEIVAFYKGLCERLELDPFTQPFSRLKLNGKEILYANKGAADQLSRVHCVNRQVIGRERIEDVYVVTVRASLPNGRTEDSIGAVDIAGAKGERLANALMKAETKAKRRATLGILGLGMLDESEIETIPAERKAPVERTTAETAAERVGAIAPSSAVVEPSKTPPADPLKSDLRNRAAQRGAAKADAPKTLDEALPLDLMKTAIRAQKTQKDVDAWFRASKPQTCKLSDAEFVELERFADEHCSNLVAAIMREPSPENDGR